MIKISKLFTQYKFVFCLIWILFRYHTMNLMYTNIILLFSNNFAHWQQLYRSKNWNRLFLFLSIIESLNSNHVLSKRVSLHLLFFLPRFTPFFLYLALKTSLVVVYLLLVFLFHKKSVFSWDEINVGWGKL